MKLRDWKDCPTCERIFVRDRLMLQVRLQHIIATEGRSAALMEAAEVMDPIHEEHGDD